MVAERSGAALQAQQQPTDLKTKLAVVTDMYCINQRVVYADSGTAFQVAVENLDKEEVEKFANRCLDGVVSIFLEQRAISVRPNLLVNFWHVIDGACRIILWDLKKRRSIRHLDTLRKLLDAECTYYSVTDNGDPVDMSSKATVENSRGWRTRKHVLSLFNDEGGFLILEDMLKGKTPIHEKDEDSGVGVSQPDGPEEVKTGPECLSGLQVRQLLAPFVVAQDFVGQQKATEMCREAIKAVGNMNEAVLKTQRSQDLNDLRLLLSIVLGNDEDLQEFLRKLSLKLFTSKAFQLRKLGLDLMYQLSSNAQKLETARNRRKTSNNYTLHRGGRYLDDIYDDDDDIDELGSFDVARMNEWLVQNGVIEKLFGVTETLHPALVGRSKELVEFMARGSVVEEAHVDLMFKSCVGHHDSVRGAVQALLAELAVDSRIPPETSVYMLQSASKLVDEHRTDMMFFVEKLMSAGMAAVGYERQLNACHGIVLQALLDLLWRLLETTEDLKDAKRQKLVDYMVEVLRMANAKMLRGRFIVLFVEILQESASKEATNLNDVKIHTAYEMLQKTLGLFDLLSMGSHYRQFPHRNRGEDLDRSSRKHSFNDEDEEKASLDKDASASEESPDDEDPENSEQEPQQDQFLSLVVNDKKTGIRTQPEIIKELNDRYDLLNLVVAETKAHRERCSVSQGEEWDKIIAYMGTLNCRLEFLQYCVSSSTLRLGFELVNELWQALEQPFEREMCMVWLRKVAVVDIGLQAGLTPQTTRDIFSKLLCEGMEFKQLSEPGFKCFSAFFLDVNKAADVLDGEVLNYAGLASDASTSTTILKTHVRAAAAEEENDDPDKVFPSSNGREGHGNEADEGENDEIAASKKRKKKKKRARTSSSLTGKKKSSFLTDFFPSFRSGWSNRGRSVSHRGRKDADLQKGTAVVPRPHQGLTLPTKDEDGFGGDAKVNVVKRPDVVGLDTLWRIVESAPEEAATQAMDLLLQVQCRLEGLGDTSEDEVDECDVFPISKSSEGMSTGLKRRIEFLDRTFAFLESSAEAGGASFKVQRCIHLITNYLHAFPQTPNVAPHAPPPGQQYELTIHHDKVLLFSKRDIGKTLNFPVPISSHTQLRRAQGRHAMAGIIVDYDEGTGNHVIWLQNGDEIEEDMSTMHSGNVFGGLKSVGTGGGTYHMTSRSQFKKESLPISPLQGVEVPDFVVPAAQQYEPVLLRVRGRHTLGALHQMILDELLQTEEQFHNSHLSQRTISLSAQIHHKQKASAMTQPYGTERVLSGTSTTSLESILPSPSAFAGVKKTKTSVVVYHVINLDVDATSTETMAMAEVERESELPQVLITKEGSKYVNMLMRLLNEPHVAHKTRMELWQLLLTLPTDRGLLSKLEKDFGAINWTEELASDGPYMLRAVYILMVVNRFLGNNTRDAVGAVNTSKEESSNVKEWRSTFLRSHGFQDVAQLLGEIVNSDEAKHDHSKSDNAWYLAWQRSIALPVITSIIRFCVQGSLEEKASNNVTSRINAIRAQDALQNGAAFSPASKKKVTDDMDLKFLTSNLSKLIVLAHRATCSQTGVLDLDCRGEDEHDDDDDDDDAATQDEESDAEDDVDEDDEEEEEEYDPFYFNSEDKGGASEVEVLTHGDEAMLEVLIDAIQTTSALLSVREELISDFLKSQSLQQQKNKAILRGASSILDVLVLSRFEIVREMLRDLLAKICADGLVHAETMEGLALEALLNTPRNCPSCSDFFDFLRDQIELGHFNVKRFTETVINRLVYYPSPSKRQMKREAKLLAPFPMQLRSLLFKPLPGVQLRQNVNTDTQQYREVKTRTMKLLDLTMLGYLELMELIMTKDEKARESKELVLPLMETLFHRFLMAVPRAGKDIAPPVASLPDARQRSFNLLKVMAKMNELSLHWLLDEVGRFVDETPVPVTRTGKFDWKFQPVDFRKSPTGFVGLVNQGATCYQNSILQQLFMAPRICDFIVKAPGVLGPLEHVVLARDEAKKAQEDNPLGGLDEEPLCEYLWNDIPGMKDSEKNRLLRALQYTFTFLRNSDKRYFNPQGFVEESAALKLTDGYLSQNDAIEFYSRLVDYLEEVSKGRASSSELADMLYVSTCTMNVRNCAGKHRTESEVGTPFLTLNVRSGMAGPTLHSLDDALESWFKAEKLSGLECEICNAENSEQRFEADQVKCFSKLPPVLVVQLQRFDFDYEIMSPTKLNHKVSFPHKIDLHRFTRDAVMEKFDSSDANATPAQDMGGGGSGGGVAVSPRATKEDEDDSSEGDKDEEKEGQEALKKNDGRSKPSSVYQLCGVVVHQGSGANFGHYYSFIKDRKTGSWFRFDDERVTPFDVRNLEEECFGGPHSGESAQNWNNSASPGISGMGVGMGMGMGGINKYKPFSGGNRDNNAYLLLYERVDPPSRTVEPKEIVPCSFPMRQPLKLRFAHCAMIVHRLQVWRRKAKLSATAKSRLKAIEKDVWEDNQRTLKHGLVMVPSFIEFCLDLLGCVFPGSSKSAVVVNKNFSAAIELGYKTYCRVATRVASQKSRLRTWEAILGKLFSCAAQKSPSDLAGFLEYLCSDTGSKETLRPMLQNCFDKQTRVSFNSVLQNALLEMSITYENDANMEVMKEFIQQLLRMLPEGASSLRLLEPYFSVLRILARDEGLRPLLLQLKVAEKLIRVYVLNDPSAQPLRDRGGGHASAYEILRSPVQQNVQDSDFEPLLDTLSILFVGCTADEAYQKQFNSFNQFEDEFKGGDAMESGDLIAELCRAQKEIVSQRYALGYPLQGGSDDVPFSDDNQDFISEQVALQIARRNPGTGVELIALACKGKWPLSKNIIEEISNGITSCVRLLNVATSTSLEDVKARVKNSCKVLAALSLIEDFYTGERVGKVIAKLFDDLDKARKEFADVSQRREYHRNSRYNVYGDTDSEEMYSLTLYIIYAVGKMLGLLFERSSNVRMCMRMQKYKDWVEWLPSFMDKMSYDICLGGHPKMLTRTIAKGRAVRSIARAAEITNPRIHVELIKPMRTSVVVSNAGMEVCNGRYEFDGYFKEGESLQIDTHTPKFVKLLPDGRPLHLYRCVIKDKQYTWYISVLSEKPGTNNDTDYYNSSKESSGGMPPITNWNACSKVPKPGPSVRLERDLMDPTFDPCAILKNRKKPPALVKGGKNAVVAASMAASSLPVAPMPSATQQPQLPVMQPVQERVQRPSRNPIAEEQEGDDADDDEEGDGVEDLDDDDEEDPLRPTPPLNTTFTDEDLEEYDDDTDSVRATNDHSFDDEEDDVGFSN